MINNFPKVSVIIPTYKRGEKLKQAINSALDQTYENIEVIIVDDNDPETDHRRKTEELMDSFNSDERVKYFRHKYNRGGGGARNTGLKMSSGDIISYLDDDDLFLPNKLEKQVQFLLDNKNFQGVYCGCDYKGKKYFPSLQGDLTKELLLFQTSLSSSCIMFYKSVLVDLNGFDESFKRHQDYELLLRFFKKNKIGVVSESLIIRGSNEGENILHGKELELLKEKFLTQFISAVTILEKDYPGITKEIYCKNYAKVFYDHMARGYIKLGLRIFIKYSKIYKHSFLLELIRILIILLIAKLYKFYSIKVKSN